MGLLAVAPAFGATTGSLGSTVFVDANWNGKQDANEPGIAGVEVRLYGPGHDGSVAYTNAAGEYLFSGLEQGHYQVKLPAAQMTGTGTVATVLNTYFGTHGIPTTVPTKVVATKASAYLDNAIRQDGDSNGVQTAGYGGEIVSDDVPLAYGHEPVDRALDSTDTGPGIEFAQTPTSNGYKQDLDFDTDGDMTVDFGVVHQCYDICDIDRNGTIDQSDIDWIYDHKFQAPTPGPGMPGSGSCGGSTLITLDDFAWCQSLKRNQPIEEVAIGNRVWKEVGPVDGKFTPGTDQPLSGVFVTVLNQDTHATYTAKTDDNGCYLARVAAGHNYVAKILAGQPVLARMQGVSVEPDYTLAGDDQTTDDSDDQNGLQFVGGDIETNVFDLYPGTSPTGETSSAACGLAPASLPDANVNETADFAFEDKVAIGNLVWIDGNKIPGFQPNSADKTVFEATGQEVQVNLHHLTEDANGDPVDVVTQMSTSNGFYLFDNLSRGQYYVEIPAKEFDKGTLSGYESMAGSGTSGTTDDNADENGIDAVQPNLYGVATRTYDLKPGAEPVGEVGQKSATLTSLLPDDSVNLTADFAFVKSTPPGAGLMSLGSTVFLDLNHNGKLDGSEPVVPGVTVELIDLAFPQIVALTDITDNNGNYFFGNLDVGVSYKVRIPAAEMDVAASSGHLAQFIRNYYAALGVPIPTIIAAKPLATLLTAGSSSDSQIDNDSNGLQSAYGQETLSPPITLVFGAEPVNGAGPGKEFAAGADTLGFDQDNSTGQVDNNGDMTVDFGFVHQCQDICDVTGPNGVYDGVVTEADFSLISSWGRSAKKVTPGALHSGDCAMTGTVTRNDAAWCRAFITPNAQ